MLLDCFDPLDGTQKLALADGPGSLVHLRTWRGNDARVLHRFIVRVDDLLTRTQARKAAARVVVVGGGAGGVEIAFAVHHRINSTNGLAAQAATNVMLISRDRILPSHPPRARALFLATARERGIPVVEGLGVERVAAGRLWLSDGQEVQFDECLWCTAAAPAPWLRGVQLPKAQHGFLAIDEFLRSAGGPANVFACGDVATSICDPRPKAGVFAVRQGPPLAENLRRFLTGRPLRAFHPQRDFLSLISTGDRHAVATKFGVAISGAWLWLWKDRIDRTFVDAFGRDLPDMAEASGRDPDVVLHAGADARAAWAATRMRCGGCAAKVNASVLKRALRRLPPVAAPHVIAGVDAADDAAVLLPPPPGRVLVQTVDFFRAFMTDPYVFGRVAANHALGDCFAMGAVPLAALAVAVVPFAVDAVMEDELYQMMAGAQTVLAAEGCALVGGHSCEGAELALGFTVTGHADGGALMTKAALRPGQVLVLTKALGTGLLMKGAMAQRSKGRWTAAAIAAMQASNGPAARAVHECGVRACTDVTGFGLIGHLAEMAEASEVRVEVDAAAVPVLEGALEVAALGVRSSLHDQNAKAAALIDNAAAALHLPQWPVLVDPQTAGGLLCGVDKAHAPAVLAALRGCGCADATIIGRVLERMDGSNGVQRITVCCAK